MAIKLNSGYGKQEGHSNEHEYPMPGPECYIYFFHTGDYIILPTYPEQLSDTQAISYTSSIPLGRSAPIYSYQNSGPRSIGFDFELHRDMMYEINYQNSSIDTQNLNDDYVDLMAKKIQGAALPEYSVAEKMVNPPIVAVKIGTDIFIKGVITGSVGVQYKPPILETGKYACIHISFSVSEVIPYTASAAMKLGSFRNADYSLATNQLYTMSSYQRESTKTAKELQNLYYQTHSIGVDDEYIN